MNKPNKQFDANYSFVLFNLTPYYQYFIENNKGLYNPYHNLNHTLCLISHIYNAYRQGRRENYDIISLLLASLFHDFNHSGGKLTDSENIKMAIKGLKDAYKTINANKKVFCCVKKSHLKRAINYIKATEYPYVIEDKDLNKNQALIRDCDILCYLADDWYTQVLMGLSKEANTTDYVTVLKKMEEFLDDAFILSRTDYAKWYYVLNLNKWKKDKEYYLKNVLINKN